MTLDNVVQILKTEQDKIIAKSATMTLYVGSNMALNFINDPDSGDLTEVVFTDEGGNESTFTAEEFLAYLDANPDADTVFQAGVPSAVRINIWFDQEDGIWYAKLNGGRAVDITGLI